MKIYKEHFLYFDIFIRFRDIQELLIDIRFDEISFFEDILESKGNIQIFVESFFCGEYKNLERAFFLFRYLD